MPPTVATTTTSAAPTTTTAAPTITVEPTEAQEEAAPIEPEPAALPVVVDEPVIISCDGGPGPVITYWSDGTVTGSTPYCDDIAESRRQAERDHNVDNWKMLVQSGPQIGDQCSGADIGRKGSEANGTAIMCDNY